MLLSTLQKFVNKDGLTDFNEKKILMNLNTWLILKFSQLPVFLSIFGYL